ncbi:MAG TPA: hypothetical protein VF945_04010 [Polyangia bacterium]
MARVGVALVVAVVAACVSRPAFAQPQPCSCCNCDAIDLTLPPSPPPRAPPSIPGPSEAELEGALAGGVTALAASYVLGVLVAWHEPHTNAVVDRLPVVGPVAAAARNASDDENVPLLLFSAGVQAMSVMLIAAAATDLSALRHMQLAFGAGPDGCGVTLTGRFP